MLRIRSTREHFAALASGDETERIMAANALSGRGGRSVRRKLRRSLSDPDLEVRNAFALGNHGDEAAIPALEALARAPDYVVPRWWSVRKEATDAISRIRTFPREDHRG